jgi:hypothetical protein
LVLVSKTRKGKRKSSSKKGNCDGGSSQLGKNKDLSKNKCFSCHKNGHYLYQCLEKKKGKGEMQTTTPTKMLLDEFTTKFEKDLSLVSFLSTNTYTRSAWFLDIGASRHMTKAWELFSNLMEKDLDVYVQLGDDAKHAVKGEGTIAFQLELGGLLDAQDVLYVLDLKNNLLSVSVMEDKGFVVNFQRGKTLIRPKKASLDTVMVIGVREDTFQGDIGSYPFICEWVDVSSISTGIVILCDIY